MIGRHCVSVMAMLACLVACRADSAVSVSDSVSVSPVEPSYTLTPPLPIAPPARAGFVTLVNGTHGINEISRLDTDGNSIDAHDGEIVRFENLYYLYGTSYGCGFFWRTSATPFCGVRIYSSPDLVQWTPRGTVVGSESVTWQRRCDGRATGCFRPHIVHNRSTNRYVVWLNTYDVPGGYRAFTSERPDGPFREEAPPRVANSAEPFSPEDGKYNGDENLFVDDNGSGYVVYTDWRRNGDIVVEALTRDYLSGTGRVSRLGLTYVEAPSLFKRGDRYYLTISDPACPYCQTGTSYVTASSPLGPWSAPITISATSCGGQPSHVSTLPAVGGGKVYLFQSDRWEDGFPNEAVASQYWAPLEFAADGAIMPMDCAPHAFVPVLTSASGQLNAPTTPAVQLVEDIGAWGGSVQREVRFVVPTSGRLRNVTLTIYKKTWPMDRPQREIRLAPLNVELFADSTLLHRAALAADKVTYAARTVTFDMDVAVKAGATYTLRVSAPSATVEADRYGFAYYTDESTREGFETYYSLSPGIWRREKHLTLLFSARIADQ